MRAAFITLWLGALAGCAASTPFPSRFPLGGEPLKQALARAKAAPRRSQLPVVAGVIDQPRSVFAYDLSAQRMLFREPAEVVALPFVAGELVVVPEADRITVRRLRDGKVVRTLDRDGMQLVGADGDGELSAIALSTGGPMNARSRLLLLKGESVSGERRFERAMGAPAVLGGLAFVPHHRVHLSVLDASGRELARVRIQDDVASQAFHHDGEVYFGQGGVFLLDEQTERGLGQGAHYWKPALKTKLPGNPPLLADSAAPPPPLESALHRVALTFVPTRTPAGLGLADDSLYLSYYRQLFALTPDAARARWVHETESDVAGVQAVPGGLLAVETSGTVTALDTEGRVRFTAALGVSPIAARVRAEQFALGEPSAEASTTAQQLERAARSSDSRLMPARALAAQLLGPIEGEEAARALIALCGEAETPTRVREEACAALAGRSEPSPAVLAALAQRPNFLTGTPRPPAAALAQAARAAGERRAVPDLLAHLTDPATPDEELAPILDALAALGDAASVAPIARFVRLYHADASDDAFEQTLEHAMATLVKLDAARARPVLEPIANDPLARAGVRAVAQRQLNALTPAKSAEAAGGDGAAEPEAAEEPPSEQAPDEQAQPEYLSTRHVERALSPVRVQLARCVNEAPEHPASARLVLVIDGDGKLAEVRTLPASVRSCIEPLVQSAQFPATKYGRRSVMSYTVER